MRVWYLLGLLLLMSSTGAAEPLPGTRPLSRQGDLAGQMVEGIDRYLLRRLAASPGQRLRRGKLDFSSLEAYRKSLRPYRARLAQILGVSDSRVPGVTMDLMATTDQPALVAAQEKYQVFAVRWPVLPGVDAEGLLLEPREPPTAQVIALPDADWTPEMFIGMVPGVDRDRQPARRLAENGCRVLIPVLIDRQDTWSGSLRLGRMTNQPHREYIYRMAYEMGRHIIGYEVQKVLAGLDWLCRHPRHPPVGIYGHGEGGLLALMSAALDDRFDAVLVSGYFGPREEVWREPIYRNVWGLLQDFGDAELALLIAPRPLLVDTHSPVLVNGPPAPRDNRRGAAPGAITAVSPERAAAELERARTLQKDLTHGQPPRLTSHDLEDLLFALQRDHRQPTKSKDGPLPVDRRMGFDPTQRQHRQFDQLVDFTQKLMRESEHRRQDTFWARLDTSSIDRYQASCRTIRAQLWEVLGKLPEPDQPADPRSRQVYDEPRWKGYELTLELYPDVFAQGILLVPRDLRPNERRPLIVCQHGLEGRPADVVNPRQRTTFYNSFGAQLADRGYIVYAPQNPYIGQDHFRQLQRKANPLGLSLFSFIIRQHERTLDWLATLPFVDSDRMAFYGLSYGGKTAMRVPPLLPRYCLSICSGDFNEWIWKNVSVELPVSYMFSNEYEMPEFNLGNTFNYAEMAALIAPRPFMVERGHADTVGIDEWVAYEYAPVRRLYSQLHLSERTAITFFAGGHEIRGQETFRFLQQHLGWPR